MERRTVFLASVGALSVVACGGEPEAGIGEIQQAVTTISPSLPIKSIKFSGTAAGSLMKLTVTVMGELYLGVITLANGGPSAPTSGGVTQGLPKRPGSATAVISSELYDFLISEANGAPLTIEIEYSKTTIRNIYVEYV